MITLDQAKTLARYAQSALDVQSACNLSGVVRTFAEIVHFMRTDLRMDTPTCNEHPICRLFAQQIAHLTRVGGDYRLYSEAYDACEEMSQPKEVQK